MSKNKFLIDKYDKLMVDIKMYMCEISKFKISDLKPQKMTILWTLKHVSAISKHPVYILGDSSLTLLSESSNLPSFRIGFASVSLDNKIFLTGTFSLSYISDPIQKGLCPK